ncbi:MAG: energy-converting hydrogenase B subunit EhbP [Candidatus Altiarchaeota archaeon]|nr:energy-converting hydrogenase B subunit EhbP [Candidatus Altiarchaeota archaeon]
MPKIVIEAGTVINMGGYVIENMANLPYIDVIIGNPLKEDIKISAPMYRAKQLEDYQKQGLIVEPVNKGEMLKDKLEKVKSMIVSERLKQM